MNNTTQQKIGRSSISKYMIAMIRAILPATSPLYANSANTSGKTDTVSSVGNPVEHSPAFVEYGKTPASSQHKKVRKKTPAI